MTKSSGLRWSGPLTHPGMLLTNSYGQPLCMPSIPCPTRATCSSIRSGPNSNSRVKVQPGVMTINSETVLISTEEAATAPLVPSHMCVEGVAPRHTTQNCPQRKQQQHSAAMATTTAPRGNIRSPNTTQSQVAGRGVATPSRQ